MAHAADADFYTSESLGVVFARLVVAAAWQRAAALGGGGLSFVELGAESADNVAAHACPPFAGARAISLGGDFTIEEPSIAFCNELLDAQPFHRVIFDGQRWVELGVAVDGASLRELPLPELSPEVAALAHELPSEAQPGYRIDLPLRAEALLREIARQPGVRGIVAFDYGLDWEDLVLRRPAGTARTYRRNHLGTDLLAHPGEQDVTCHVCWDRLERVLAEEGFHDVRLERQEAHFMRHAQTELARLLREGSPGEQATLRELIHPMRLGSAFQVLSALRE